MSIQPLKRTYTQVTDTKLHGFSQNKFRETFKQSIEGKKGFWDSFSTTQWTSSSLKDSDAIQLFLSFLSYGLRPENPNHDNFLKYATTEKGRGNSSVFNIIKAGDGQRLKNALNMNIFKNLFYKVYPENIQLFNQMVTRLGKIKPLETNDSNNVAALADSIVQGVNVRAENN